MTDSKQKPGLSLGKKIVFSLILAGIVGLTAFVVAELFLRVVPVPGITFHTFYFDEITGQRFYPNTTFIYRNARGDHVRRKVNSWGYLDKNHSVAKAPGVVRIGFFGDSFTEARQVPTDSTFPQLIERRVNSLPGMPRVESIAISMMGYSTLQSYLEYKRWGEKLDLDVVAYVFCENDPGNMIPAMNRSDAVPYPVRRGDSLAVDYSFAERYKHKTRRPHRMWQYLKSHSLVFSTLEARLKLLRHRGVKVTVGEQEMQMAETASTQGYPNPRDLPSSWPDSLVVQAGDLAELVLTTWRDAVESSGRRFVVIYIPRPTEMSKPREDQDSWAPWLFDMCNRHGIDIVDPTDVFVKFTAEGVEVYYDHLAEGGHEGLARAFVDQYRESLRR